MNADLSELIAWLNEMYPDKPIRGLDEGSLFEAAKQAGRREVIERLIGKEADESHAAQQSGFVVPSLGEE